MARLESLADRVAQQKRRAERHRDQGNWFLLVGFAGAVPVAIYLVLFTRLPTADAFKFATGAGLAIGILAFFILRGRKARCPNCRFNWEINEHLPDNVLVWNQCPNGGLPLRKAALEKWLQEKGR